VFREIGCFCESVCIRRAVWLPKRGCGRAMPWCRPRGAARQLARPGWAHQSDIRQDVTTIEDQKAV
jgi:hypothetical protein